MSRIHQLIGLGILCLGLGFANAALAEVLLLKDGSRVETRGAFEVKGRRVLFHDTQGRLVALRLDEVDLDGSRAASQPAPAAAAGTEKTAPAAKPKREPVLVLTDRDVAHVDPDDVPAIQQDSRIVMYSTSWCGYCRKARSVLDQLAVSYDDFDVEKSDAARSSKNRLDPDCGVPLIDFGGELVCGFSEPKIRQLVAKLEKKKAKAAAAAAKKEAESAAEAEIAEGS